MTMGRRRSRATTPPSRRGILRPRRLKRGKTMLIAYAEPLERIEQRYGVPGPVLVAIWGLETDFGAGLGQYPTFSALATLGLRLPSRQPLSGRAHRRADDRPARPPAADADARRMGGRAWPDPVHAVRLPEIRGFGERRARRRSDRQFRRRARLDREFSARAWLAARARSGTKVSRTSPPSSNGTAPRSTPRRSREFADRLAAP